MCTLENALILGPLKAFDEGKQTVEVIPSSPLTHFWMFQFIHNLKR